MAGKARSLTVFLTGFLLFLFLLLFTILLCWMYISTSDAIGKQQQLSIELNNRNSSRVLDANCQLLRDSLQRTATSYTDFTRSETLDGQQRLIKVVEAEKRAIHLDLVRFVAADGPEVLSADAPFFDFNGIEASLRGNIEKYLSGYNLLAVGPETEPLWLLVAGERVVLNDSGRVAGVLIGGIVLSDNPPLVRDILQRTNAEYAALQVGDRILASNKPLPEQFRRIAENGSAPVTRATVRIGDNQQKIILSRYSYPVSGDRALSILLFYQDTLQAEMQQLLLRSGTVLFTVILCLFSLVFLVSRKQVASAMNSLLEYTRQAAEAQGRKGFAPGPFLEFNQVGEAVEKMVGLLDKAGDELRENKERLELVIRGAELATWDWNIQSGDLVRNERWAEIIGYRPDEINPDVSSWKKNIHPDEKDAVLRALGDHLEGRSSSYVAEYRLQHRSGHWVWILDAGKVFRRDKEGKPIRAVGIHLDISRRKEAEKALSEERALLFSLINSTPDLIFYKDRQSVYLGCNRAFEKFTGKKEKAIVGVTDLDLFPKEVAEFFRTKDREMFASGEARRNEEWVTYPDGRRVLLDTLKTPFNGPDGKLLGILGISRDITRMKATEQELADERERLAVTLRSIGDAVITTDTEGKVLFLNQVAEELTGWSNGEAKGQSSTEIFQIINEKTGERCASPVQRVIEYGRIIGLANHTALIARDGTRRSIADSGAPIRDKKGKIVGVVIVFRDISREQIMEEELLKVRKLESIGVLAGGIAHDFNNILSIILGNIELATILVADHEEAASLLFDALKASNRAVKLTKQLLTFSKGGDPVKETTSLPELIRESADFVLHGSHVNCSYRFPANLWLVDVDSGQFGQVIQNIILNAKHAMPGGGTVEIQGTNIVDPAGETLLSTDQGEFVCISIRDHGVGIPREIIDRIFDPYFSTKQEGSGLGLAICHSIVNKHNGYLTVQSNPGKGTTFKIYLPATFNGELRKRVNKPVSRAVRALRVMVMDDEEMLRRMVARQLTDLGHEPVLVEDGEQAINRYLQLQDDDTQIDLVIMDLTIPGGMGGEEAARRLLQIDPAARIIVVSGYSNDPVLSNYLECGFRAAMMKPFDQVALSKAIEQALL